MALNENALGSAIVTALDTIMANYSDPSSNIPAMKQEIWRAISKEFLDHIKNNLEITVNVPSSNNNTDIVTAAAVQGVPTVFTSYGTNPAITINVKGSQGKIS